jgi:ubiquinone/menaquinone biosynthesis C-methylase UbiE
MNPNPPVVLPLFDSASRPVRLHVSGRWRLFPFPQLLPYLPETGHFLDVGCGHGLWALMMAQARPTCPVWGVDPDVEKTAVATQVARQNSFPNLHFFTGQADALSLPACALISLIDVLYLIPFEQQARLLQTLTAHLVPGGVLLLNTMGRRPRWKYAWNLLEETLAVRVLRITYGTHFYFRPEKEWQTLLENLGLTVETRPLHAGYLHPHILFIARK